MNFYVGVDVGASVVRAGICDHEGKMISRASCPTRIRRRNSLTDTIIRAIRSQTAVGALKGQVVRICVATVGPLNRRGGIINPANMPKMGYLPLVEPLHDSFGCEIVLVNDCVAAALVERERGRWAGVQNLTYVSIGTGIGAGVVADGRLLMGKDGNAHEVGHMVLDCEGRLKCGCGGDGHWEAYCSGSGLPAFMRSIADDMPKGKLKGSGLYKLMMHSRRSLKATTIFRWAERGDVLAEEVLRRAGWLNAMGVASVINAYDPEVILFGGGVVLGNWKVLSRHMVPHVGLFTRNRMPVLNLTSFMDEAPLRGATLIATECEAFEELKPWRYHRV